MLELLPRVEGGAHVLGGTLFLQLFLCFEDLLAKVLDVAGFFAGLLRGRVGVRVQWVGFVFERVGGGGVVVRELLEGFLLFEGAQLLVGLDAVGGGGGGGGHLVVVGGGESSVLLPVGGVVGLFVGLLGGRVAGHQGDFVRGVGLLDLGLVDAALLALDVVVGVGQLLGVELGAVVGGDRAVGVGVALAAAAADAVADFRRALGGLAGRLARDLDGDVVVQERVFALVVGDGHLGRRRAQAPGRREQHDEHEEHGPRGDREQLAFSGGDRNAHGWRGAVNCAVSHRCLCRATPGGTSRCKRGQQQCTKATVYVTLADRQIGSCVER